MTDQEDNINLGKNVFDNNNQERENRGLVWNEAVPDL